MGSHYELRVRCRGEPDPRTGYFLNIKHIDEAVRSEAIPIIEAASRDDPLSPPHAVLSRLLQPLNRSLGGTVHAVRWMLSPYHSLEMHAENTAKALLRQQFEFAASHRLHVPSLSDEENRRLFGKCNNRSGHGHNYRVEPCVEISLTKTDQAPAFDLQTLERLTRETVIDRLDHKHLNEDVPDFHPHSGLNPSVENIARVCFQLLQPAVSAAGGATLRSVTVWETDKTSCTYPA